MADGGLGKTYDDGEIIVRQGDVGDCMFVIQAGQVEVVVEKEGVETVLRTAEQGEFIGEMAIKLAGLAFGAILAGLLGRWALDWFGPDYQAAYHAMMILLLLPAASIAFGHM